jgi:hypothetical protein
VTVLNAIENHSIKQAVMLYKPVECQIEPVSKPFGRIGRLL